MNQKLYIMSLASIGIILVYLTVCQARVETRSLSASAPRKPPFNGSIYGKRSSWPASFDGKETRAENDLDEYYQADSPVGELALIIKQRQALLRASLNECVALHQASALGFDLDQPMEALCAKLIASYKPDGSLKSPDSQNWFGQLLR